jgi:hypothetical protein
VAEEGAADSAPEFGRAGTRPQTHRPSGIKKLCAEKI